MIFHPDYTSIISLFPLSPDQTVFAHSMLTPRPPASDQERDHFERSFRLIDQGVFQAEDIFVSEGAQRGMRSGANSALLFGGLEDRLCNSTRSSSGNWPGGQLSRQSPSRRGKWR